eukprot:6479871-Amphidinium_carterae.1
MIRPYQLSSSGSENNDDSVDDALIWCCGFRQEAGSKQAISSFRKQLGICQMLPTANLSEHWHIPKQCWAHQLVMFVHVPASCIEALYLEDSADQQKRQSDGPV